MTSNLVFIGVAVVKTEAAFGARCAVAILSYFVGVGLGSAIAPPSGDFDARLRAGFERLVADEKLRAAMSASAAALCDGLGADRVAERLLA